MNYSLDELTNEIAPTLTRRAALKRFGVGLAGAALACWLLLPPAVSAGTLGPLLELSRPNAVGTCDDGIAGSGPGTINDAAESFVVVNPVNPKNIVVAWIQGPFQNIVSATSFDGGKTWQQVPMPLTVCSGGPYLGAGDPWLSFAPNGELHAIALVANSFDNPNVAVNKSTDGGLHWSAPNLLAPNTDSRFSQDKPSIKADSSDPRYVYAVWEQLASGNRRFVDLARTTNNGLSWELPRHIIDLGNSDEAQDPQIFVMPDGTLVCMFIEVFFHNANGGDQKEAILATIRSADRGQTWSVPITGPRIPIFQATDPDTGTPYVNQNFYPPAICAMAVDPRTGNLYVAFEDTHFSGGQYADIAFTMSTDRGSSWSLPIPVNRAPVNIPAANRQAFTPAVAVAADGTIGVTYYDFRFNDSQPGLPTDYWLVQCHPSRRVSPTDPANWGEELRLTARSFDMEKAWAPFLAYFMGDYEGLAAVGNDFVSVFSDVDADNLTSVCFRRVGR
ncbi:MAG TPA: sialidase family protein [Verrucomicrobiae bacterium]|nr:sialidase family protein [Verrucomicrobiae bacterium]